MDEKSIQQNMTASEALEWVKASYQDQPDLVATCQSIVQKDPSASIHYSLLVSLAIMELNREDVDAFAASAFGEFTSD